MKRTILGLDIGNCSIKAVVVEKQLKGFSVLKSLVINFDDFAPQESSPETETESPLFQKAISALVEKIAPRDIATVAIALPSSSVSFRNITLPFRSKKKIRQVLEFELAANLPLADTRYVSDFTDPGRAEKTDENTLLTASIPDNILNAYFTPLGEKGFKPALITIQGYIAAEHMLAVEDKEKQDALWIDCSEDHTTLCLSVKGKIAQVRSLGKALSHNGLVRAIVQTMEGETQRSCGNFLPKKCTITSQGEPSKALFVYLEKALDFPVHLAELDDHSNALAAALAQNTSQPVLNFCRERYAEDSILKRHAKNIAILLVFTTMAFSAFMFKLHDDIHGLEKKGALLDGASVALFKKNFPQKGRIVDPLMQMKIELEQLKQAPGLGSMENSVATAPQLSCIETLAEISNRIPATIDVETTRFILNPGRILLSGSTANFNDIDKIKGLLEDSDLFKQVEIQSAAADKTGNRVRFKFMITQ